MQQSVRVIGGSLAKIAEAQSDQIVEGDPGARATSGLTDEQIAQLVPETFDWERMSRLIDYGLRLQLRAAALAQARGRGRERRRSAAAARGVRRSRRLHRAQPGARARGAGCPRHPLRGARLRHRRRARRARREDDRRRGDVRGRGARVPRRGSRSRLTRARPSTTSSPTRAPASTAARCSREEGDYYGPVVNLASRLVEIARPGSVLASSDGPRGPGRPPVVRLGSAAQPPDPRHRAGRDLEAGAGRRHQPRESRGIRYGSILVMAESPRDQAGDPLAPAVGPRPPRRRGVEGGGHRRASTPPRACTACSCAAPAARRATS